MKKTAALLFTVVLICLLAACVPDRQMEVLDIGPNIDGEAGVAIDFELLTEETINSMGDLEPYNFVVRVSTEGTGNAADGGTVHVYVGTLPEVLKEDMDAFAAAFMKSMGSVASGQYLEFHAPGKEEFGDFWDKFSLMMDFIEEGGSEQEGSSPCYVYEHKAGEPVLLNPDVNAYEKDYYKRKEILERSL